MCPGTMEDDGRYIASRYSRRILFWSKLLKVGEN